MRDEAELAALRSQCTTFLLQHGHRSPADYLAELPDDIAPDRYGDGGVVGELEDEVAGLLGTEAAGFFPSGIMAQQAALRVHADLRNRRTIVFHPTSHLWKDEDGAMSRLHGLQGRPVGDSGQLVSLEHLEDVAELPAALVLELPQRWIGGQLPSWGELEAQVAWARERGAAAHCDGARLWQCPPAYERNLEEIAGLFDTIYVSFYKDLGGLAGSCLAGSAETVAGAKEWRKRHGGTLYGLWPLAASALAVLRTRLPRMADYRGHALAVASELRDVAGVRLVPDPPQATMFQLLLRGTADELEERIMALARDEHIWTWQRVFPSQHPDWQLVELTVGDATMQLRPAEVRRIVATVVGE